MRLRRIQNGEIDLVHHPFSLVRGGMWENKEPQLASQGSSLGTCFVAARVPHLKFHRREVRLMSRWIAATIYLPSMLVMDLALTYCFLADFNARQSLCVGPIY